jgi:acetyl-CoA C-acetyltransferase
VRYAGLKSGDQRLIDANDEGHRTASGKNSGVNHMGNTAENVARLLDISREEQDKFAYRSNMNAVEAQNNGRFAQEIIPVEVKGRKGKVTIVDKDGDPRPDTTIEKLSKLRTVFEENGTVTAGNASSLNDGAAFEIMTTETTAKEEGLEIMGRVVDYQISGCDPKYMGLGPVYAINDLLKRQGMDLQKDIDLLEINEAFSAQTLGCLKQLGISTDSDYYKNNFDPHGGAVAMGHPLGMSGARILTEVLYEFKNRPDIHYAIASACIGGGQGIAMLLENGYWKE